MKYCAHCGSEILDEAVMCPHCGCKVENEQQNETNSTLAIVIKVFMILGTIAVGLATWLIGLAWCIPMTLSVNRKLDNHEPITTGFKVCVLLFVNLIAGILLLCMHDDN